MNALMCPGQTEMIQLYLDRELSPAESHHFVTHLETCPACQEELARLAALYTELASLDGIAPPPALVSQVMAHLPAQSRRASLGQLVLTGQIVAGLALLISALPLLSATIEPSLWWTPWLSLAAMARSLAGGITEAVSEFSRQLMAAWPPSLDGLGFQVAPGTALLFVACLGLIWGIGNFLLLNHPPHFLKNRGVS